MVLTDIAIEHIKKARKGEANQKFTLHPYQNGKGPFAGKFEILRDSEKRRVKNVAHVTERELAELYARNVIDAFEIRLRVCPADGEYPTEPPGKNVPRSAIRAGSDFEQLVNAIDVTAPVSAALTAVLERLEIKLPSA